MKALGKQIPIIFVDSPLDEREPFVGTDNHQSVPLITEYLCRSGERPTWFDMPAVNHNAIERRKAYAATMARLNIELGVRRDRRARNMGFRVRLL